MADETRPQSNVNIIALQATGTHECTHAGRKADEKECVVGFSRWTEGPCLRQWWWVSAGVVWAVTAMAFNC